MKKKAKIIQATIPQSDLQGIFGQPDPTKTDNDRITDLHNQIAESAKQAAQVAPPQGIPFDFSKVHLHIGLPCYGGQMQCNTMTSLIQFFMIANQIGLKWSLDTMTNESLVQRARNGLCAKMMHNQEATHFFFLDADIAFDPESIVKLIVSDKDIIAGVYPKKTLPISYNINLEKTTMVQGPLYTVFSAATGFLMFKRKVYEDLLKEYPEESYLDDIGLGKQYEPYLSNIFAVFVDQDPTSQSYRHLLSEDWAFCVRAKKLGYKIWVDSTIKLDHIGNFTYSGQTDLLKIKPSIIPK